MEDLFVQVAGRSSGDPVLCVHGLPFGGRMFARFVDALGAEFRLYVPDLAGMGRSASVIGDLRAPAQAGRLARWMRGRRVEKAVVVGQGAGGLIGASMLARFPRVCRSLLLLDDPFRLLPRRLAFLRTPLIGELRGLLLGPGDWRETLRELIGQPADLEPFTDLLIQTGIEHRQHFKCLLKLIRSLDVSEFKLVEARVRDHPLVHLVAGDRSCGFSPEEARTLAGRLGAGFTLFEGVGSLPALEAPDRLAELIRALLEKGNRALESA